MRLAICDDEPSALEEIERLVREAEPSAVVQLYESAENLLTDARKTPFDLVFMDIEMPPPNGFDAAVKLRQLPQKPLIVFVTHSGDYTIRGYGVAFRYLKKPVSGEEIASVLTLAAEELAPDKLVVQTKSETLLIPMTEIRYIEVKNHHVLVSAGAHSVSYRGTLGSLLPQLPNARFAQPHSSFVINLDHVCSVSAHHVLMTDGSTLPLSQRRKKDFEAALFRFVRR